MEDNEISRIEKIKEKYKNCAYSAKYDAYYDRDTGEWAETACSDPDCPFDCTSRPEKAF